MKCISILFTLLLLLTGIAKADPAAPLTAGKSYDLYLLIGQSNMAGRGTIDAESKQVHPRVFMLDKENQWAPATDPLHYDKPVAGVGPGLAFGKAMADATQQAQIGLVPCAVGGTSIKVWAPGKQDPATKAYPYDDMLKRMQIALKDGTLKGIIWHQGESDRNRKDDKYSEEFMQLVARLRNDLNAPDVPIVIGELGLYDTSEATTKFNARLHELVKTIPNCSIVSAEGLTDRGDRLHFDAKSARELGKRYAEAMRILQAPK